MHPRRCAVLLAATLTAHAAAAQKFYPDDPLIAEPPPFPAYDPEPRALSDILELFSHTFGVPGETHPARGVIPAGGVNTLGEVMDGDWFVNRHGTYRLGPMSQEELQRGSGTGRPPADGQWQVLTVKQFGFRPGILIADATGQLYLLRFDPRGSLEMATGAEVVSTKFFYALGYFVPEAYIVYFERDRLVLAEGGSRVTSYGDKKDLREVDVDSFLTDVARDPTRGYRAAALRVPGSWEGLLGPYQVFGVRSDDPNDIVPHEHRRDLRGLFVFASWLNHTRMGAVYTMDALMIRDDVPFVRHYLVDFYATLGSGGFEPKKSYRGNEYNVDFDQMFKNIVGMGVYTPKWMRASFPHYPSVGRFEYETFEPERWKPVIHIAPFVNRLPDDTYWAAKKVMAFTDDDIRAIVRTGEYSEPDAAEWIARCLIERRDRIGATYFAKVLPLDHFEVRDRRIQFEDLEVKYGFTEPRSYLTQWSRYDNATDSHELIASSGTDLDIPPLANAATDGSYFAVQISAGEDGKTVTAYMRKAGEGFDVVGIDRDWPGKVLADSSLDFDTGVSVFNDLKPIQIKLFETYADRYNQETGFDLTPQEIFDTMTISERTTYDAVTHALMHSSLTDEAGSSLGNAIDLVSGVERVAGQYYGRSGDQQFRLYVFLRDDAKSVLEQSQEFTLGHLNTVYHVGYPYSFRQGGSLPNIQFSVSEDGTRADIDVDYRSSKMPQAMFNGHLTSSNSDVRAGDNHEKHVGRWGGFVAWWQSVFGNVEDEEHEAGPDLLSQEPTETPTPLPPDRPFGADPEKLEDASQEFLTDWLVRGKIDESLHFLSNRALACVDTNDEVGDEVLRNEAAIAALREAMEYTRKKLGRVANLTEAIDVVLPWRESIRVIPHAFDSDFAMLELSDGDAAVYLCGNPPDTDDPDAYGTYFANLFRFKAPGGATLGIMWTREEGKWRIVAWEVFEQ